MLPKTPKDYQLINHYAFSSAIYRLTNKHITIEESTNNFHNSTLCINKVSLKRCTKADGSSMTLIRFNLVNNSDRPELLKGGGSINNKKSCKILH